MRLTLLALSNRNCRKLFQSFFIYAAYLGSISPLLLAPGNPASGVRPILRKRQPDIHWEKGEFTSMGKKCHTYDVSTDCPLRIAQAEAPLPMCSGMMLVEFSAFFKNPATDRKINE